MVMPSSVGPCWKSSEYRVTQPDYRALAAMVASYLGFRGLHCERLSALENLVEILYSALSRSMQSIRFSTVVLPLPNTLR